MKLIPLLIACTLGTLAGACVGSRPSPVAEAPRAAAVRVPTALTSSAPAPGGAVILGIQ